MLPQLKDGMTVVMGYMEFKLGVDTTPDTDDYMLVEIRTRRATLNDSFDMDEDCVRKMRDACNEFLANLEE